jgi:hypothetical protein
MFSYDCTICGTTSLMGEGALDTHMKGTKHQRKLAKLQVNSPREKSTESNVTKKSFLSDSIAKNEPKPLIGLGYVLELCEIYSKEPNFICVLCEKRCELNTIVAHVTSHRHRMKYLVSVFIRLHR